MCFVLRRSRLPQPLALYPSFCLSLPPSLECVSVCVCMCVCVCVCVYLCCTLSSRGFNLHKGLFSQPNTGPHVSQPITRPHVSQPITGPHVSQPITRPHVSHPITHIYGCVFSARSGLFN